MCVVKLSKKCFVVIALTFVMMNFTIATAINEPDKEMPQIKFTEISRDEYLTIVAEEEGITIEEADRLDRMEKQESYKREAERYSTDDTMTLSEDQPTLLADVEKYVHGLEEIEIGSRSFNSTLSVSFVAKAHMYTVSSIGSYIRFTDVRSVSADLTGEGTPMFDENSVVAQIVKEETHGNWLEVLVDGIAIHELELSEELSADARAELGEIGFGVSASSGANYTYTISKAISETVRFYSNDYYSDFS